MKAIHSTTLNGAVDVTTFATKGNLDLPDAILLSAGLKDTFDFMATMVWFGMGLEAVAVKKFNSGASLGSRAPHFVFDFS